MGQLRAFHRTYFYVERIICFLNAVGAVAQLVEYRTRNQELGCGFDSHPVHALQATLSKSTVCSGQLSLLPLAGREMSSSYDGNGVKA